ncbi:DUF6029 family protein [Portibacter lacus]|uniref:Uncharacterized protein n=1 Tax=Portibacter lacus TaxID=1099794 RepID=A0AA37SS34_9BACT|nr:DUF6029 family protein [Portibacter lacus]GLR17766.1 hypothetical protein GCM10007940_23810 [Portibacter lacus]
MPIQIQFQTGINATLTVNMSLRIQFFLLFILGFTTSLAAQSPDKVQVNGAFQGTLNYFIKDAKIGAANTPQYEGMPLGADAWLNVNADFGIWRGGVRFDFFHNSNLLNPSSSYTDRGLGLWYLETEYKKLDVRIGGIYNQIGSGIIYRAYEERPLLIDNALKGIQLAYDINDEWKVTTFAGKQRYLFSSYDGLVYGGKVEGFMSMGEDNPVSIVPGIGFTGKRLSDGSVDKLISILRNYTDDERIEQFTFHSQALSIYNSLNYKAFSWYFEGAYKLPEVSFDPNEETTKITGVKSQGRYLKRAGTVFYSTLSYAKKGLGITLEGKRTENFDFRIDPTLLLNNGLIGFLPPMNHITSYRLTSRYNPATQFTSELAFQLDVKYKINKKYTLNVNTSNVNTLENENLYREFYIDLQYKPNRKFDSHFGLQRQIYNQSVYEGKPKNITPVVKTWTPYVDLLYKFTRRNSLKVEAQYMSTEQDYGSWVYLLAELGLAPHWRFELSGMYNIIPNTGNPNIPEGAGGKILYPTSGVYYIWKQSRYGLRYVKQVEGVVCTGGVCRLEPAFSGFKFEVNSLF